MGEHKRKKPKKPEEAPGLKKLCEALSEGLIGPVNDLHEWTMDGMKDGGTGEVHRRHAHVGRLVSGFLEQVANGMALGRAESEGGPLVMAVKLTFLRTRDLERRFFEDVVLGPTPEHRARDFRALAVGSPSDVDIACRQLEEARQLIEEEHPWPVPAGAERGSRGAFETLRHSIVGAIVEYSWGLNRWVKATPPGQGRDEATRRYHAGRGSAEQSIRAIAESFAEWHRKGLATITLGERLQEWIEQRPENRAVFRNDLVGASDPARRERAISEIARQLAVDPAILRSELTGMVDRLREASVPDEKESDEVIEEPREKRDRRKPNWQPIGMLDTVLDSLEGIVESSREQHATNQRVRPGSLDRALLNRMKRVFTEREELLGVYSQQFERWSQLELTAEQARKLARCRELSTEGDQLNRTILDAIVSFVPIEDIMEMDETELALKTLSGEIPLPGGPGPDDVDPVEPEVFDPAELDDVPGAAELRKELTTAFDEYFAGVRERSAGQSPAIVSRALDAALLAARRMLEQLRSDAADWEADSQHVAILSSRIYEWILESADNERFFKENVYEANDPDRRRGAVREIAEDIGLTREEGEMMAKLMDGAARLTFGEAFKAGLA